MNPANEKMKVEIWSDIMCPFCYIGKRHFEAALAQSGASDKVEVTWKSFQLDPSIPEDGHQGPVFDYLAKRMGVSVAETKDRMNGITGMAQQAGLDFRMGNAVVANSFRAHRLIQMAKTKGLGDAAEERLFRAYFTEGKDFGSPEVLVVLGKEIGLEETDVRTALEAETYADRVRADIAEGAQKGVRGVPFFVFNDKYGLSGAQPTSVFTQALAQALGEWQATQQPELIVTEGSVCDVNGNCS